MLVIFCNLSSETTKDQFFGFTKSVHPAWRFLRTNPKILYYEIVEVFDSQTQEIERHGLVRYQNATAAMKAINRLNGRLLNDREISVRKFVHRSPGDHRYSRKDQGQLLHKERRRRCMQVADARTPMPRLPKTEGVPLFIENRPI